MVGRDLLSGVRRARCGEGEGGCGDGSVSESSLGRIRHPELLEEERERIGPLLHLRGKR